ncbi:MAG: hypothetical protein HUJ61_01775, partial [Bacilli bacterium]|nr:hypothetical protein [Bacilli bacterium]
SVLKRPIMVDDRRIQVGYNEEEIRTFIPRDKTGQYIINNCCDGKCGECDQCPHSKECK